MKNQTFKIGVIGCGNMGGAIVLAATAYEQGVVVYDVDQEKVRSLQHKCGAIALGLREAVESCELIILAVKPQQFDDLLSEIAGYDIQDKIFLSIAAGIKTRYIEKKLGKDVRVIRAMPNLPVQVNQGITALAAGQRASEADLKRAASIFDQLGSAVIVDEKQMDAVTALSGSGPAYVFLFMECLRDAGMSIGLPEDLAAVLATQTVAGSMKLLEQSGEDPAILRARVTSKGGTTQAALETFESHKIRQTFKAALKAAKARSKELSK